MRIAAIATLTVLLSACAQPPRTDLESLKAMRDAWQSAFSAGDTKALAALYAAEGAVMPPNSEAAVGRAAIDAYWAQLLATGMSGDIRDTEVYGQGDVGYKIGTYTLNAPDGSVADNGKYVEIWRNIDGKWQLYRDIFNSDQGPIAESDVNRVVITADVEDADKWEENFRTHGELLGSMSQSVTYFTTTDDNKVTLYSEPSDLSQYMEVLESPATADAMKTDGVKRDTVKVYVLDKEFVY